MAMVDVQIYYPRHTSIWQNLARITGTNIVQTNIHHCSKVFTTNQARAQASGNPDHYVIKCVGR